MPNLKDLAYLRNTPIEPTSISEQNEQNPSKIPQNTYLHLIYLQLVLVDKFHLGQN